MSHDDLHTLYEEGYRSNEEGKGWVLFLREPSELLWRWSCDKKLEGCWEPAKQKLGERRVLSTKNRNIIVNLPEGGRFEGDLCRRRPGSTIYMGLCRSYEIFGVGDERQIMRCSEYLTHIYEPPSV